jgi:hypothetical protein
MSLCENLFPVDTGSESRSYGVSYAQLICSQNRGFSYNFVGAVEVFSITLWAGAGGISTFLVL